MMALLASWFIDSLFIQALSDLFLVQVLDIWYSGLELSLPCVTMEGHRYSRIVHQPLGQGLVLVS